MAEPRGIPQGGYDTGDMAVGGTGAPLSPRNDAFASGVAESNPPATAMIRGRAPVGLGQQQGARLAISPSMKTVDPTGFAAFTQANGRLVPPAMGESAGEFYSVDDGDWNQAKRNTGV